MSRRSVCALVGLIVGAASVAYAQAPAPRPSSGGTIKGHIAVAGAPPGNTLIRMGMDPKCAAMNARVRVFQNSVVARADGSLADVFVRLEGSFAPTPVPSEPVIVDQRACVYGPRVVGVRVGQALRVRNDDDVLHNVHSSSARGNTFNVGQPKAGVVFTYTPKTEEVMVKLGCDVHRWMTAFVGVVLHPYFAVSGRDGTFEMGHVPAGTHIIRAWHERLGELTRSVTVRAGGVTTLDMGYSQTDAK